MLIFAPAAAQAQPGPGVGWVRVGHLSPEVPPVDLYITPFGQEQKLVIRKAGYGAVTPYSTIQPGKYTLSMRPADADAATPPALSAAVDVTDGTAYSLLVFTNGPGGALNSTLVIDTMQNPGAGNGGIRVVQGSAAPGAVTAAVVDGPQLGANLAYGTTTPYAVVAAGTRTLQLSAGSVQANAPVSVTAGSVVTVLITQEAGGLRATAIVDASGTTVPPLRGVETGGGGAVAADVWPIALLVLFAAAGLAMLGRVRPGRGGPGGTVLDAR